MQGERERGQGMKSDNTKNMNKNPVGERRKVSFRLCSR